MHPFVSLNNQIIPAQDVLVSALSSFALYGKGIFTTIAVNDRKPFLWDKHWRRITNNSARLGIDISNHCDTDVRQSLDKLIKVNDVNTGRARLTFFDESPSAAWPFESERNTSLLIMTGDLRAVPENFRLTVSPYLIISTSPLAGIKSSNYLEKIIALDEAKLRGLDEAVQVNERGEIASVCMANIFWQTDGRLFTPSLKTGCLAGTTREFVLENCQCSEVAAGIEALENARSIFLTSAGIGVVQVAEFDGMKLKPEIHRTLDLWPGRN